MSFDSIRELLDGTQEELPSQSYAAMRWAPPHWRYQGAPVPAEYRPDENHWAEEADERVMLPLISGRIRLGGVPPGMEGNDRLRELASRQAICSAIRGKYEEGARGFSRHEVAYADIPDGAAWSPLSDKIPVDKSTE